MFLNKIDLSYCCLPASQAVLKRFRRVSAIFVFHTKIVVSLGGLWQKVTGSCDEVSAENRLRIHNLRAQNRLFKTESPKLNTHELNHMPDFCLSTPSIKHTKKMTFAAIKTLQKITHNISTFKKGETSSNYSEKSSLSPHTLAHGNSSLLAQSIYSRSRM